MARRRTSPCRSDDSQPVETEAVCRGRASSPGRTGSLGRTTRTQRGCMRLAVAGHLEGRVRDSETQVAAYATRPADVRHAMTLVRLWHASAVLQEPLTEEAEPRRRQRARSVLPGHVHAPPATIPRKSPLVHSDPCRTRGPLQVSRSSANNPGMHTHDVPDSTPPSDDGVAC